jgi:PAS domain S-box-containing protein
MNRLTDSKILVVDDDPKMCASIQSLLGIQGFDVQASENLPDARNALEAIDYDLVLLDLKLHDQSGFSLMDYLTENRLDTHVIVVTGQHSETLAITALKKGATDYLKKPFNPGDLLESVRKVLARQRHQRELSLFCLNTDLVLTFVNKTYADCWGKTPQAMIGQPIMALVPDSIQPMLLSTLKAIRSGAAPIESEYPVIDANGRARWQQWRLEGIRNAKGRVIEIQGTGRDVTRKKSPITETEEDNDKFRILAEIISDWIWEVDRHGVYTYTSPVVYNLLGYRPEEIVGMKTFDFMPADEAKQFKMVFQRALATGEPLKNVENVNLHKDGSRVTLETSGVPIVDESGKIAGYRGVDRDISIRKCAEERLREESDKLKQALAKVKRLSGMLPICASCKKIRDDKGYWNQIEAYIEEHSDAAFSHGICPQCARKLYPELYG